MRGNPKVHEMLNEALWAELSAISQYFVHAESCDSYGYERLHQAIRAESIDEMRHAEKLIERLLYLEGKPNMGRPLEVKIGAKVDEMLNSDLKLEKDAVEKYNRWIAACAELGDNGTREMLAGILKDEERHLDFIEAQLTLIDQIGLAAYLSQQVREEQK